MLKYSIAFAAVSAFAVSANAEEEKAAPEEWVGESAFSASATSGNSETTDVGLGVDVKRDWGVWTTDIDLAAEYGQVNGEEAENRYFAAGQLDRELTERAYSLLRASYEQDEFSGFANRTFVGAGLGYFLLKNDRSTWNVEAGPGYKSDRIRGRAATPQNGLTEDVPSMTEEDLGVIARSEFSHQLTDTAKVSNKTLTLYSAESTQIANTIALTTDINHSLAARIGFEVRHDTNPPPEFEATDTAAKFSIVYTFGD